MSRRGKIGVPLATTVTPSKSAKLKFSRLEASARQSCANTQLRVSFHHKWLNQVSNDTKASRQVAHHALSHGALHPLANRDCLIYVFVGT